ncbi:MAG TPA: PAS domain-containing protein [Rhodocyclaceae bacterium]|nr:PAS domain-containing protein [Rhodocyclaceae bacterium]
MEYEYITEDYISPAKRAPNPEALLDEAGAERMEHYGALILDGLGKVHNCNKAAADMFGVDSDDMSGRSISDFISNFSQSKGSPSYAIRHIAYLCEVREWARFTATNAQGQPFEIELKLSRVRILERDHFLLTFRVFPSALLDFSYAPS